MKKLQAGDLMPQFTFQTAAKTNENMHDLLRNQRTIFWVLRYIGCTTCRYDVDCLARRYNEVKNAGAQAVVLMQSEPENVLESLNGETLPFEIICDTKMEIYKELCILPAPDKETLRGTEEQDKRAFGEKIHKVRTAGFVHGKYEGDELQLPALFIVEPDLTLSYAHYARSIADMPDLDQILALL